MFGNHTRRPGSLPSADAKHKTQLGPEDWIAAATELLVDKSVDAVRVEALSKKLSITRGSFYHHFESRDDLLGRLLTCWRTKATEQIIERFEKRNMKPRDLLRELLMLPAHGGSAKAAAAIELAIRTWARHDKMARQFVDEVDNKRLAYIAQCFSALGFDIGEARMRAFLLYSYQSSESLLFNLDDERRKEERRQFVERLLLRSGQ